MGTLGKRTRRRGNPPPPKKHKNLIVKRGMVPTYRTHPSDDTGVHPIWCTGNKQEITSMEWTTKPKQDPHRIQIGVYHVETPETHTQRYECAAWYREIKIAPGDYPIFARFPPNYYRKDEAKDTSISVWLSGTVIASDFSSYYCGVPVGKGKRNEDTGQPAEYHIMPYAHALAIALMEKAPGCEKWRLFDGFEPRWVPFTYNGKECRTAGIFRIK